MTLHRCLWLAATLTLLASLAHAQDASPAELRREIEALRAQIDLLTEEREEILANSRRLQDETNHLRNALAASESLVASLTEQLNQARRHTKPVEDSPSTPEPAQTPTQSPAETPAQPPQAQTPIQPLSSPESMRLALERSHRETFPALDLSSQAATLEYRRKLDQWITSVKRSMRGQTRWRIIVSDVAPKPTDRTLSARIQVVQSDSLIPIGPSFITTIPSRLATRFTPGNPPELWELTLAVAPDPIINERRLEPGPFNHPEWIGPMIEFSFTMDWIGLRKLNPQNPSAPTPEEPTP